MPEIARHKIHIEGRWELRDLYVFPQRYGEIYSFLYALSAPSPHGRFIEIFQRYPWRGGYSAVNFYDDLYLSISSAQRPRIASIEYGSPGYIELSAVLLIVTQIDRILNGVMKKKSGCEGEGDRLFRWRRIVIVMSSEVETSLAISKTAVRDSSTSVGMTKD